jgi:hypothetical protein
MPTVRTTSRAAGANVRCMAPPQTIGALRTCDFIVEATTEDEALKLKILGQVDAVAKNEAIVATNTSSISIIHLAKAMKRPPRFVGLHFFNPVPLMVLVEVWTLFRDAFDMTRPQAGTRTTPTPTPRRLQMKALHGKTQNLQGQSVAADLPA